MLIVTKRPLARPIKHRTNTPMVGGLALPRVSHLVAKANEGVDSPPGAINGRHHI
jgi:hypothetical protein